MEKYLFVGVSPKPFYGCNYWYIDESFSVKPKTYVWVRMGRHNREQVVYVDSVKLCDENSAPYPPQLAKRVIRIATEKEIELAKLDWEIYL